MCNVIVVRDSIELHRVDCRLPTMDILISNKSPSKDTV